MLTRFLSRGLSASAILLAALLFASPGRSQNILDELEHDQKGHDEPAHDMRGHEHHAMPDKDMKTGDKKKMSHGGHEQMSHDMRHGEAMHGGQMHAGHADLHGFLGSYPMAREGSGTSWQPDTTPHIGVHAQYGEWQTMYHALFNGVYDLQGGPRGGDKTFLSGMFMGMAQRPLGDGTLGLRAMLSPDPFMGANGYPLLLATGETANGRTPLIDRQHPHDLFMELATTYSYDITKNSSVFLYAGLPGEPALGPPAFMHRLSGMDIPEAPITHHWLDSTHITFGVVTAGVVLDTWKVEASAFKGREPDQYRYDIEAPQLDSFSGRVSWNPIRELSLQASWGHLHSPEQLEPDKNQDRITASATYTQPFGKDNVWSTTAAWGRKMVQPGNTLDGFILETAAIFQKTYTIFARLERVQEDELVDLTPAPIHTVNKASVGGIYDFYRTDHAKFGIGGLMSFYGLPGDLKPLYGEPTSGMVFVRLKIE
jgi:hypothetical protein